MSKRSPSPRTVFMIALLVASLLALIVSKLREPPTSPSRMQAEPPLVWRPEGKRRRSAPLAGLGLPAAEACLPHASERCSDGDVWAFDSCGTREQKVEECGPRACSGEECVSSIANGCTAPPEGVCVGNRVELCLEGKPFSVDCAAQGLRCANGAEGAACAEVVPEAERCHEGAAHCEGSALFRCVEGRIQKLDCAITGSQCRAIPEAGAACVRMLTAANAACGPCGCATSGAGSEQLCDGRDEDGDGLLDEELGCGAIALIAFRVVGPAGGATSRESIRDEVEALNRTFAATELPGALQFVLEDIVDLPQPGLSSLREEAFKRLASDPLVHPARENFYVPVLFTDRVLATGEVPKPGMSTLPNGTCGGMQDGQGPEVGLVAIGKARYPTTLAHEIGHFFGLCHTHDTQHVGLSGYTDAHNALQMCEPVCSRDGDGLCDTPLDPGPTQCRYDQICHVACAVPAAPDVGNLMSYYADCRENFSPQQMRLMQHTAALRRGWQRCLGDNCACRLSGEPDCPIGMGCRPRADVAGAGRCALEGPRLVREECRGMDDCKGSALCVRQAGAASARCVRSCLASRDDCTCVPTTDGLRICQQDLTL
ncbi:MAG TPA: M43 family zinc metalloprotease [Polyangiales bacterium]